MKTNKRYKFLSKSVLLEESGLPRMYGFTILAITAFIIGFIFWASQVMINDTVSANGYAIRSIENEENYEFIAKVSSKNIAHVRLENEVTLSIPGITDRERINGCVAEINHEPEIDSNGRVYYEIIIEPKLNEVMRNELGLLLLDNMEIRTEIVTGNKTLLQYILGPLWDASEQ
jgi:multidrug efflux pump subunit AcrA (membrane-fusion protein)